MSMLESCPPALKEAIIRLLHAGCFVEAKALFDQWRQQVLPASIEEEACSE